MAICRILQYLPLFSSDERLTYTKHSSIVGLPLCIQERPKLQEESRFSLPERCV